jgi:hypothetical protein
VHVCLASRGGEVVGMSGSSAPVLVLCRWETLKNSLPMAIPKRRPDLVFAINGQMAGLAMLGAQACASFYFVQERIFCSYGLAPKPPPHATKWFRPRLRLGWCRLTDAQRRWNPRTRLHLCNLF